MPCGPSWHASPPRLLASAVSLADLADASGSMHDADDDPSEDPATGDAARSADAAARIDLALLTWITRIGSSRRSPPPRLISSV